MVARRATALVLAAALATGLAACGGGDDEDGSEDVQLDDVESDASSSASSTEDEADEGSSDEGSDDSSGIDEEAIAGAFSEGCGEFVTIFGALGAAIGGAFDAEAAEEFEGFVDDAPDEIRDDLETIAEVYQDYAEALEDAGFDLDDPDGFDPTDAEAIQVFTEAAESFNTDEFNEANENINEFVENNCEV